MRIVIETIPHETHRYPTVGDYWEDLDGTLQVRVSELGDRRYELLVALHEVIEAELCRHRGVKFEEIDAFDVEYEKNRPLGDVSEPGNDVRAPYYKEHQFATFVEREFAEELGVDWDVYETQIDAL